mmetsp:Transcript_50085/g.90154  ORF Transcript_50085/g.90154 Transcript_50085/m.90154 type:complete len:96 (+) Transcript_50085:660-947(+)
MLSYLMYVFSLPKLIRSLNDTCDPKRVKLRTLNEEPRTQLSTSDIVEPKRAKPRNDSDEPKETLSSKDIVELRSFALDKEEPNRMKLRIERDDPR